MGSHLARLEVGIVFDILLDRIDEIELNGPPERLRSNFFNGIKRMPVRVSKR
jgi:cholest-4-en-3-one 26-monooxygenase